jgi:hypothetical protein
MKRSTRISLLVFTICAAILAFGALWYTRPSSPSYIIEEAKRRQEVPLLEVTEPATRTAPAEINYELLAKTVSPIVRDSLVNDDDFMSELVAANKVEISNAVKEYTTSTLVPSMNNKISELVEELAVNLNTDLKADLISMVDEKIQATLDSIDINTYLPQLVDSLTPIVVEEVYNMVEANKDDFITIVQEVVPETSSQVVSSGADSTPSFTTDDAKALYFEYREQIIMDLVPIILDQIESSIVTSEVVQDSTSAETSEAVADSDATSEEDAAISATIVAKVLDSNDEDTTESDGEISIPTFYQGQTQTMTSEEYQAQREEIRNQAIADALSSLSE